MTMYIPEEFQEFVDQALKNQDYPSIEAMLQAGLEMLISSLTPNVPASYVAETIVATHRKGNEPGTNNMIVEALKTLREHAHGK